MAREIKTTADLDTDLATRFQMTAPSPERSSPEIDADFETLMSDGFVVLELLFLYLSGGCIHFFFDSFDFCVSFVDCDGFDFFGEGQFFDAFLDLL